MVDHGFTDLTDPPPPQPLVLIVEDDESVRRLFVINLELAGLATLSAADGREALQLLREHPVDVVLLDAVMPVLDGHATLAEIRRDPRTASTAVIFVTGARDVDERVRGLDAGADDYLEKPIDPDELVARVRAHLRGRDAWRRALREQLDSRSRVAQALGRVPLDAPPTESAAAICACLEGLAPGTASAVVVFEQERAEVLAGTAGLAPVGSRRLPRQLASRLQERARDGAWVEQRVDQPADGLGVPLAASTGLAAAAFIPLPGADGPLGVLALADPRAAGDGDASASLSAGIDLAPVVAAMLRTVLFRSGRRSRHSHRVAALRRRIRRAAFTPVFQPIVDLRSQAVVGFEALTRFADGASPEAVFSEAAALGVGLDLEAATARAALAAAGALPEGTWVSVNASPGFVMAGGRTAKLFADHERPIVVELTEHDRIEDYADVRSGVAALQGDIRLSVDDAGSGYACLNHILELRPAYVKLDRGWITGIDTDLARQALVSGLRTFAERTDGRLIAEGIEQPAEAAALLELGVPLGQGFLLGRPAASAPAAGHMG